jgi:alpha-beta hydrolase superfamily lysophospholipase
MSIEAVPLSGQPSTTDLASTRDGLTQLRRFWPAPEPRAAMLIVHGIGEHSGRYEHVGSYLAARGIDVLAFDNRGFGQSGGKRGHVDRFDEFLDDVEDLLAERRRLSVPVVLFGHSLGGLIATTYLVGGRPRPDLAVLSSPALQAVVPGWQRAATPVLGRLAPRLFVPSRIDGTLLSRDPAVGERYRQDPLVVGGTTAGLARAIFETMDATGSELARLTLPALVVHGEGDDLVPATASAALEALPNVTRRLYPELRHECFNEPEHTEVLADLAAWLDVQLDDLA